MDESAEATSSKKKGNCKEWPTVPQDVKLKIKGILETFMKAKDTKEAGVQILMNNVHVGKDEEDDATIEGSSSQTQRSIFGFVKTEGPMDKFATRAPKELAVFVMWNVYACVKISNKTLKLRFTDIKRSLVGND